MTRSAPLDRTQSVFEYEKWHGVLPELAEQYQVNRPFPHIHPTDFLDFETAAAIAREFPSTQTSRWTQYKHANENKLGLPQRALFPPRMGEVTDQLNSPEFVAWLSELTGIPNLIADPDLEGGGLHQSERGGFLNVHTDFSMPHYHKNWQRRVNLILYLNPNWQEEWGGAIEFWDLKHGHCGAKYAPELNHCVIFHNRQPVVPWLSRPAAVSRRRVAEESRSVLLHIGGKCGPGRSLYRLPSETRRWVEEVCLDLARQAGGELVLASEGAIRLF